jgi:hypothetical protein
MADRATDQPTRPLDTGIFALAVRAMPTMPPAVRCLQTLTAAALVFAILGACGLPPPRRGPRPIPRPRRPGVEITIRSLTGRWEASRTTTDGRQRLELSLVQRGDTLEGTLLIESRTLLSANASARLDAAGQFVLVFGQLPQRLFVRGRPDATGDRIPVLIDGLDPQQISIVFQRK